MSNNKSTRRDFLKTAAVSTGAFTLGNVLPAKVLGANDRINFGIVGTGGMGTGHLNNLVERSEEDNINVPAVCDVYQRRLTRAMNICNGDGYLDYRKLLDRSDIDAVLIATPDHWHAKIAIEAMESGKHVFVEKPITHTVEQALEVREAVKRYNKVLQVGPQRTSEDQYWKARDMIMKGRMGKVTWAQGSYNRNVRRGAFNKWFLIDETAGPHQTGEDYIDWDMWLGHKWELTPRIPWNPEHFFRFRKYFQYNGGVATDLLYHFLAPLLLAIVGENGEYPYRANANGGLYVLKDGRDIPDVFMMAVDYPSEFTVYLASVLTNNTQIPTRIYGQYATAEFPDNGGNATYKSNGDFKQEFRDMNDGYDTITIQSENTSDMRGNFMDVIRKGGKLFCNVDLGVSTMVAIKMGTESYRQNKTMFWDAENERMISR
ncbi:Gfo/Idh/MocA family oxidoreductase [Candidatus Latescibacterota bacterium]